MQSKEVENTLQKVGFIGISDLADFTAIDYSEAAGSPEEKVQRKDLWKQFLRYVQSK